MGFRVYLCRKNEAVIKYAKRNYARHRIFDNLQAFNEGCIEWLRRTGNAEVHGTTKKVPDQVFAEERKHLKPIPLITIDLPMRSAKLMAKKCAKYLTALLEHSFCLQIV